MTPEREIRPGVWKWVVDSWAPIERKLPKGLSDTQVGYLERYFEIQMAIAGNDLHAANDIAQKLYEDGDGASDFEDEREDLFAAIDIAVRGVTNRNVEKDNAGNVILAFKLGKDDVEEKKPEGRREAAV